MVASKSPQPNIKFHHTPNSFKLDASQLERLLEDTTLFALQYAFAGSWGAPMGQLAQYAYWQLGASYFK